MLVIINCILALIFLFVLDKVKSSQNIVNFKDNRDLQGGFFIGCGEVNTEQYYYYYCKTDKGSYKASKIKADDCEIIYTKDTPHIDIIVKSANLQVLRTTKKSRSEPSERLLFKLNKKYLSTAKSE